MDPQAAYREQAARSEDKLHLVIVLYEQMVRDLTRAEAAIADHDIERRSSEINHALEVLAQLHGRLDFAAGGEVAHALDGFYSQVRLRLEQAHFQASSEILREQISLLLMLRDAWVEVERQERSNVAFPSARDQQPASTSANWRA
jgi:flagellar protein FliS